jgi:hypothetical protein
MFQPLFVILVYVVGPIAILVWAVKRYRSGIKPGFNEIIVVVIAVLLLVLLALSSIRGVSDRDADEAEQVVSELVQRYDFPVQAKFQERPAVEAIPRPRRLELHVYGVLKREEQDKVGVVVEKLRRQISSKPVVVYFFREEVWKEEPDGSRQPRRDKEELLRTIRVD